MIFGNDETFKTYALSAEELQNVQTKQSNLLPFGNEADFISFIVYDQANNTLPVGNSLFGTENNYIAPTSTPDVGTANAYDNTQLATTYDIPTATANTIPTANNNTLPNANANTMQTTNANTVPTADADAMQMENANATQDFSKNEYQKIYNNNYINRMNLHKNTQSNSTPLNYDNNMRLNNFNSDAQFASTQFNNFDSNTPFASTQLKSNSRSNDFANTPLHNFANTPFSDSTNTTFRGSANSHFSNCTQFGDSTSKPFSDSTSTQFGNCANTPLHDCTNTQLHNCENAQLNDFARTPFPPSDTPRTPFEATENDLQFGESIIDKIIRDAPTSRNSVAFGDDATFLYIQQNAHPFGSESDFVISVVDAPADAYTPIQFATPNLPQDILPTAPNDLYDLCNASIVESASLTKRTCDRIVIGNPYAGYEIQRPDPCNPDLYARFCPCKEKSDRKDDRKSKDDSCTFQELTWWLASGGLSGNCDCPPKPCDKHCNCDKRCDCDKHSPHNDCNCGCDDKSPCDFSRENKSPCGCNGSRSYDGGCGYDENTLREKCGCKKPDFPPKPKMTAERLSRKIYQQFVFVGSQIANLIPQTECPPRARELKEVKCAIDTLSASMLAVHKAITNCDSVIMQSQCECERNYDKCFSELITSLSIIIDNLIQLQKLVKNKTISNTILLITFATITQQNRLLNMI